MPFGFLRGLPRRKLGVNPTQERCCIDGAVSFGYDQSLERFVLGRREAVMRAKSEYIHLAVLELYSSDSRDGFR